MFGYVKIFKPELKVREYEQYRAVYCTVCKRLGREYGHLVRMSLSYDFAFLAALGISANGYRPEYRKGHCIYDPLKKCSFICSSENTDSIYDFVCACAVIMLYYKITDDIRDKNIFSGIFLSLFKLLIKRRFNKACRKYPDVFSAVSEMDGQQQTAEDQNDLGLDMSAEPSSSALGKLCAMMSGDERISRVLYRIGYCVGKWVYLADALDDLEKDVKHGRYNPLINVSVSDAAGIMNICSNECGASFELLENGHFTEIIKNIFYLGLPNELKRIIEKKGGCADERSV